MKSKEAAKNDCDVLRPNITDITFTPQPTNTSLLLNFANSQLMTCSASGGPRIMTMWWFDDGSSSSIVANGSDTVTHNISSSSTSVTGTYYCIATIDGMNDTSDVYTLFIAPYGVNITGNNTYPHGSQLQLHCSSEGGPQLKYSWSRTNPFSIDTTTNTNNLTISNVTTLDGGNYTCTVTNDAGSSSNTVTVYDPVIISDGGKVENQSIVNDFNNDDVLELMCRSDNMFDVVEWIMINQTGTVQRQITNTSNVSSTLTFSNPSDDFTSQMRCTSNNIAHRDVFITKENPFYLLLTNQSLVVPLGSSTVISIIIAIDCDGTRSQQDNVTNSLVFHHTSNSGDVVNVDGLEQDPINFQLYHYTFPPVQRSSVGTYTIISGSLEVMIALDLEKTEVLTLTRSFSSITLLEGDTVTLSCTPSITVVILLWAHNGTSGIQREDISFSPPDRNHSLTIKNPTKSDSGVYTCRVAIDDVLIEESIRVTVIEACQEDFSDALFWDKSRTDVLITQPCSELHPNFRSGVNIGRWCQSDGSWSPVDVTNCTMFMESNAIVLLSFTVSSENNVSKELNITDIQNTVTQLVHKDLRKGSSKNWSHESATGSSRLLSFVISYNLNATSFPAGVLDSIQKNLSNISFPNGTMLVEDGIQISAYQPNSSCSCNVTDDKSIRTVCTGPSTPPCLCRSPESCKCNNLTYVGDGNVCGLDSDSDGFPDVGLDCDLPQCKRDLCVEIYSKTEDGQSDLFCKEIEDTAFMGCQREIDGQWKITWPPTNVSEVAIQKCPGGSEAEGLARRKCLEDGMWDIPDVAECHNVEQIRLERRANELNSIVEGQKGDERDMTQTFRPEVVENIAEGLEDITTTEQPLLPNDIDSTANTIDIIISTVEFTQLQNVEVDSSFVMNVIEDATNVLDSLLDERNDESFEQMTNRNESDASPSIGERMLSNIERIGTLLSSTLDRNSNETVRGTLAGNNTVIEAQIPSEQDLMGKKDIDFPTDDSSSVSPFKNFGDMVPRYELSTSVILEQMKSKGARIPIITSVARSSRLSANEGERIDSVIISIQISDDPQTRTDLGDEPVILIFDIGMAENTTRFRPRCAFFDFSNLSNQSGRFSVDGIAVITRNSTYVQCTSNHLTSFAVLVDVSGGGSESQALSIVSYIGCAVSIVCLIVAVVAFIALRRKVFNLIQHFVHLNLSIALLLGLITFVSGIEAASEYGASCLIVAILLHYFFMAAFSWMLCEGVLLFIMLKFVFYRGFFKRRLFFLILGWGLPVPIVIISAAVSHEQYGVNDRCWISEEKGAIWAFVGPMLLIIMANFFFLIVTMHEVFKTNRGKSSTEKINALNTVKSLMRTAVIIVPLLGCTWVFGLLAINEGTAVFAWIFTVLNSLQGVSILFLYVLKNEKFLRTVKVCGQKYYSSDAGTQSSSVKMFTLQKNKKASDITLKTKTSTICDSIVCNDDSFQINCSSPLTPISVFNNDKVVEKFSFQPELTPCTLQEENNEKQVATSQSQDEIHHQEESTVYTNEDAVEETYL